MNTPFITFWVAMIFGSIAWYGFLVFYLGIKAGGEIRDLIQDLEQRRKENRRSEESRSEHSAHTVEPP